LDAALCRTGRFLDEPTLFEQVPRIISQTSRHDQPTFASRPDPGGHRWSAVM